MNRTMQEISPRTFDENIIQLVGFDWMLVSAGDSSGFNTMTASWGGMGYLWNKPVTFVFVRPERYTREFIDRQSDLTLSFFDPSYRPALTLCGKVSGRDSNKVSEAGLTPTFTQSGNPTFQEARLVMECKKLFVQQLDEQSFLDPEVLHKWYKEHPGGLHRLYIAEIKHIWRLEP